MGLHQFVGGSTAPRYSLLLFESPKQKCKLTKTTYLSSWLNAAIQHLKEPNCCKEKFQMRLSKFISDQVPSLLRRFLFRDVSEKCEVVRFRFLRMCVSLFFDLAEICDFVFRPHMFCRKIKWSCKAMTDLFDPAQFLAPGGR